jgi:hypothetical protein
VVQSRDRVDIAAAAHQLGITPDGVRKRIKRGQLAAYHSDGRTYVVLDNTTDTRNGADTTRHDQSATDATRCLIGTLQSEVAHLRQELEVRNAELQRKDSIILALSQRPALEALPAGNPGEGDPAPPRRWWEFWKR